MAAGGDVALVSITTTSGCAWTAAESLDWITITTGASGTGNGTLSYTASANTSTAPRSGTLTVAGQTITVTQDNPAEALPSPSNLRIISKAEQGPSLGDQPDGIGAVAAAPEDDPPFTNGRVATIAALGRQAQAGCELPVKAIEGFIERA